MYDLTRECRPCVFFFFKQQTAYEMRISDWSSDVCSSDLVEQDLRPGNRIALRVDDFPGGVAAFCLGRVGAAAAFAGGKHRQCQRGQEKHRCLHVLHGDRSCSCARNGRRCCLYAVCAMVGKGPTPRSEERRVGQEWVSTCRSRWSRMHEKK